MIPPRCSRSSASWRIWAAPSRGARDHAGAPRLRHLRHDQNRKEGCLRSLRLWGTHLGLSVWPVQAVPEPALWEAPGSPPRQTIASGRGLVRIPFDAAHGAVILLSGPSTALGQCPSSDWRANADCQLPGVNSIACALPNCPGSCDCVGLAPRIRPPLPQIVALAGNLLVVCSS
jgi:hypothetical protein